MGLSPYKSAYMLWTEKTGRVEPEDISGEYHVSRGTMNEPVALGKLEQKLGLQIEANTRFVHPEHGYMACEVDGHQADFIVEIKCMGLKNHELTAKGEVPEHYLAQCHYNMAISGMSKCIFVSYRPEDGTLHEVTIEADKVWKDKVLKAAQKFWEVNVLQDVEPERSELDVEDMSGNDLYRQLAEQIKLQDIKKKEAEESLKLLKSQLDELLTAKSITAARGCGLRVRKYERKGSIDYKKVPELKGLDLEPYRKKSVSIFDVRVKD